MRKLKISRMIPVILSVCLLVITVSCNNVMETEVELLPPSSALDLKLISKAGQISYWKHAKQTLRAQTAKGDTDENALRYPFETIKILKVTRYTAEPFDAGPFNGINELFVTDFSVSFLTETSSFDWEIALLTFKYEGGEYSCLVNGGRYNYFYDEATDKYVCTDELIEINFMSHIQLTENAVEKTINNYPVYGFHILSSNKKESDEKEFFFGYKVALSPGNHPYEPEAWFPLKDKHEVIANDVYHVDELID